MAIGLMVSLGVGVTPFPMTAQAEPVSETPSQPTQATTMEAALYGPSGPGETRSAIEDIDPVVELPDLRSYPAGPQRKRAFFELLVPIVEAENARIAAQRAWLERMRAGQGAATASQLARLASLCEDYGVDCRDGDAVDELLARVNIVPLPMVVIQAVEESGWGTSRFARQGNNLFGLRCFAEGCGLAQRGSGRQYQTFDSVQQAVRTYLRNLNTHDAYSELRQRRVQLAREGRQLSAEALIDTLTAYSVRDDYRDVLLSLLRTNDRLIERHRSDNTV